MNDHCRFEEAFRFIHLCHAERLLISKLATEYRNQNNLLEDKFSHEVTEETNAQIYTKVQVEHIINILEVKRHRTDDILDRDNINDRRTMRQQAIKCTLSNRNDTERRRTFISSITIQHI